MTASKEDRTFPKDTPRSTSVENVYLANFLFLLGQESLHSVGNCINLGVGVYVSLNSKQNSEKSERREVAVTPKIEKKKKKRPYRADNGIKTIITSFGVTKYTVVLKPCLRAPKAGALGQPRGIGLGGRWEVCSGWEGHIPAADSF